MLRLTDTEKAAKVFDVLAQDHRPRMSLAQIAEAAGISLSQAQQGWSWLRKTMPDLAIMEPHRQNTVYYLSDDFSDGARYILWQTKHLLARMMSDKDTVRQLSTLAEGNPKRAQVLRKMARALDAVGLYAEELIITSGAEAGLDESELEKLLEAAAA